MWGLLFDMRKTTLIIGAGVNKEINGKIELGYDLLLGIAERVTDADNSEKYLSGLLEKINVEKSLREKFVKDLNKYKMYSEYASIDDFLHKVESLSEFENFKKGYLKIAKVAIIFHVLGFEGSSTQNNITNHINNETTWISLLSKYIDDDIFKSKNGILNIITFNYDRILEQFLLKKFKSDNRIIEFINRHVHHVYGRIGCLDKLDAREFGEISEQIIDFGLANDQIEKISEITDHIELIYEERKINSDIKRIVKESDEIFIMGYGFDYTNNIKIGLDVLDSHTKINIAIFPEDPDIDKRKENKIKNFFDNARIYTSSCSEFLTSVHLVSSP